MSINSTQRFRSFERESSREESLIFIDAVAPGQRRSTYRSSDS